VNLVVLSLNRFIQSPEKLVPEANLNALSL
jgi:hypothetical protein